VVVVAVVDEVDGMHGVACIVVSSGVAGYGGVVGDGGGVVGGGSSDVVGVGGVGGGMRVVCIGSASDRW